jgi:hypothetical protein
MSKRYLRISIFPHLHGSPITTVTAVDDLQVPVEDAINRLRKSGPKYECFAIGEVFEHEGELEEATIAVEEQIDAKAEENMAVLYFWTLMQMPKMKEGGSILPDPSAPGYPAPLSGAQARAALEQVARTPGYKESVSVFTDCEDGTKLQLLAGEVTERPQSTKGEHDG